MKPAMKRFKALSAVVTASFILILFSGFRSSQEVSAKWSAMVIHTGEGEADIHFTAEVPAGWRMYSQSMAGSDGPLATNIEFDPSTSYQLVGTPREKGKSVSFYQKELGMEVKCLEGKVVYIQHIKYSATEPFSIQCMINYMLCKDTEMLPPGDEDITISIEP